MINDNLHIIYGDNVEEMTLTLLKKVKLADELSSDLSIGIKPNLVLAKPSRDGATTSPEIVEGLIKYLQDKGLFNIKIMESSWVGGNTQRAYKVCGYKKLSNKYGIDLIDLKYDNTKSVMVKDLKIKVCQQIMDIDYLINIPVLKAHCQTKFTCALKNLKGCIPDSEKRRFHTLGLHKPIAYLNRAITTNLVFVDAINGDLTFEEGGNPVQMNRLILGKDPVLVDTYGASLIGYTADEIEYIKIAEKIGIGSTNLDSVSIKEYNQGRKSGNSFSPSSKARKLANIVIEKNACSACYGSLIHALQRLSEKRELNVIKNNLLNKYSSDKIHIGQGYRGIEKDTIGIGNCTKKFKDYIPGCPPSAIDIVEYLKNI